MVDELACFDLPLSPNAVEQRIGRVDRFNLRARADGTRYIWPRSTRPGSPVSALARNVAGVFDQSVATLQRPLENAGGTGPRPVAAPRSRRIRVSRRPRPSNSWKTNGLNWTCFSEIEDIQFFTDFSDASFNQLLRVEEHPEKVEGAFARLMGRAVGIPGADRSPAR